MSKSNKLRDQNCINRKRLNLNKKLNQNITKAYLVVLVNS